MQQCYLRFIVRYIRYARFGLVTFPLFCCNSSLPQILTFGNPSLPECIQSSVTLQEPCGVAISHHNSEIFVADTGNHTIRVFDRNGNYKTQMTYLNMTNDFEPMGLALANEGRVILVTDAGNRQVNVHLSVVKLERLAIAVM